MCDFNDFESESNANQTIVQLQELREAQRRAVLHEQQIRREEQLSYLKDLRQIVPNLKLTNKQQKIEKTLEGPSDASKPQYNRKFMNILMQSEWMMESPANLEDFLLLPCPKGQRMTLALGDETSKLSSVYYRNGLHFCDLKTNLPHNTILDCIYYKGNKTLYLLDVLMYDSNDMINSDAAFRRFWIKSKFHDAHLRTFASDIKLKVIEDYDFIYTNSVKECFQKYPAFDDGAPLDGFLFYHKESSYSCGKSPLVLWLFPFMIDEVLNFFHIHTTYMNQRPLDYTNYLDYIKKFEEKMKKKEDRRNGVV